VNGNHVASESLEYLSDVLYHVCTNDVDIICILDGISSILSSEKVWSVMDVTSVLIRTCACVLWTNAATLSITDRASHLIRYLCIYI
jgi:hypothetical protein